MITFAIRNGNNFSSSGVITLISFTFFFMFLDYITLFRDETSFTSFRLFSKS